MLYALCTVHNTLRLSYPSHRYIKCHQLCRPFSRYHVHEKAILMVTVPAAVFALAKHAPGDSVRQLFFLSVLSTYSLFPLLFRPQEYAIKVGSGVGMKGI